MSERAGTRLPGCVLALSGIAAAMAGEQASLASDVWGGSLGVTSDYLVRGISRSDDLPALQFDYHYLAASGFVAGVFSSTAKIDRNDGTGVELNAFVGFAWSAADDWRGKVLVNQYAYPWSHRGDSYSYAELDLDVAYRDWLDVSVVYSPNFPRYVPYTGLYKASSTSAEINLQQPVYRKLLATGGVGYSYQSGDDAAGYVYWSVGLAYDMAPMALALSYVDTSAAAKSLFYYDAAGGRWVGTVIWRF